MNTLNMIEIFLVLAVLFISCFTIGYILGSESGYESGYKAGRKESK